MKEVFFVGSENRQKAEDILRKDDAISRGSITVKQAQALGISKDGYFIIIDNSEENVRKAEALLKGVAEKHKGREEVIRKVEEEENSAIEGFGNILG